MRQKIIYFLMVLMLLPICYGASLTDSLINSTLSNTTINITGTIYFDVLTVGSGGIYFEGLRAGASDVASTTFNLTQYGSNNSNYFITDLPTLTKVNELNWQLSTTIGHGEVTVAIPFDCSYTQVTYTMANGTQTIYPSTACSGNVLTFTNGMSSGVNTISVAFSTAEVKTNIFGGFFTILLFLPVMLIIIIGGFVILALKNPEGFSFENMDIPSIIIMLVTVGMLIAFCIIILNGILS